MKVYVIIATYDGISDVVAVMQDKSQAERLLEKLNSTPRVADFALCEEPVWGMPQVDNKAEALRKLKRMEEGMLASKKGGRNVNK
jgi:hypothetical protein